MPGLFTGMLGHDLRNPLGTILSGTQLALRRSPDDRIVPTLERIHAAGERMAVMIEQLLDFKRVNSHGTIDVKRAPADLAAVCRRALEAHRERPVKLEIVGDPVGRWDEHRLAQVVSSVIANAVKHGEPSAPLEAEIDGSAATTVTLRVHNQGAIPDAMMPLLFEPFRGSEHRRDRSRGLGLGLFIAQQIVLAHHGTIDVASSAAAGTTFTIALPRGQS